jgi:hypothetical protein
MTWMEPHHARIEVMEVARRILRKRHSGRIIQLTSARNDVRGLIIEYRRYRAEAEAALARDGIPITATARTLLLESWTDALVEHGLRVH